MNCVPSGAPLRTRLSVDIRNGLHAGIRAAAQEWDEAVGVVHVRVRIRMERGEDDGGFTRRPALCLGGPQARHEPVELGPTQLEPGEDEEADVDPTLRRPLIQLSDCRLQPRVVAVKQDGGPRSSLQPGSLGPRTEPARLHDLNDISPVKALGLLLPAFFELLHGHFLHVWRHSSGTSWTPLGSGLSTAAPLATTSDRSVRNGSIWLEN